MTVRDGRLRQGTVAMVLAYSDGVWKGHSSIPTLFGLGDAANFKL